MVGKTRAAARHGGENARLRGVAGRADASEASFSAFYGGWEAATARSACLAARFGDHGSASGAYW